MSDHARTVIVLAKEPVPGRVKTRLQPDFSAIEAAQLAAAAIEDTVAAVRTYSATRRILAWEGKPALWQGGLQVVDQPSGTFNLRLAAALAVAVSDPDGRTSPIDRDGYAASDRPAPRQRLGRSRCRPRIE